MLLRKPFVNRRRKKKSGLAVDRAEMAHQCSAQAPENQFHNDSLRHAQTIKSDRLLGVATGATSQLNRSRHARAFARVRTRGAFRCSELDWSLPRLLTDPRGGTCAGAGCVCD